MPYNNKGYYGGNYNNNYNNQNGYHRPSPYYNIQRNLNNSNNTVNNSNGYNRNNNAPKKNLLADNISQQRKKLPIFPVKHSILQSLAKHPTVIFIGETGSGKTTQLPQFIREGGLIGKGKIAITQPRRVAAISIATRVASEVGTKLGEVVGYTVRFEDVTSADTKIKYLTDGMLLREAMLDPLLKQYSVVILDEAHERTIHTDVLFGIVKAAQEKRRETDNKLKLLIMSATMDVDHFSSYFGKAPVLYLEGRQFAVNHYYAVETQDDYTNGCLVTLLQLHEELPGDSHILVFLTGQDEIESLIKSFTDITAMSADTTTPVKVLPLYASLASQQQLLALSQPPPGTRKIVVATNIAETSITIEGMKVVIDGGMVKAKSYQPGTGLETLKVQRISQAQAWQRAGRVGRQSEGFCYRVYTQKDFNAMLKHTVPEIQRCNLASMVLQLLAIGVTDPLNFDFLDPPKKQSIECAIDQLSGLDAILLQEGLPELTTLGKQMARFPLSPQFSKVVIASKEFGCTDEIVSIIAMLSGESVLFTPSDKQKEAHNSRKQFISSHGDHITLLNIFRGFKNAKQQREFCVTHFLHLRHLQYAVEVRKQLSEVCQRCQIPSSSCGLQFEKVRECLLQGLYTNIAELQKDGNYIMLDTKQQVWIHPSSVLFVSRPSYIIFTEVIQTGKSYIRDLSLIDIEWLSQAAPKYYRQKHLTNKTDNIVP